MTNPGTGVRVSEVAAGSGELVPEAGACSNPISQHPQADSTDGQPSPWGDSQQHADEISPVIWHA